MCEVTNHFSRPPGTFSLWCHPKFEDRCHSVVEFIERAIMHSKNGKFLYFLRSRVPGKIWVIYPHAAWCDQTWMWVPEERRNASVCLRVCVWPVNDLWSTVHTWFKVNTLNTHGRFRLMGSCHLIDFGRMYRFCVCLLCVCMHIYFLKFVQCEHVHEQTFTHLSHIFNYVLFILFYLA